MGCDGGWGGVAVWWVRVGVFLGEGLGAMAGGGGLGGVGACRLKIAISNPVCLC